METETPVTDLGAYRTEREVRRILATPQQISTVEIPRVELEQYASLFVRARAALSKEYAKRPRKPKGGGSLLSDLEAGYNSLTSILPRNY